MVDKNGSTIYIGGIVTFTQDAPRRLIGRHGVVRSLGDVRVKVELMPVKGLENLVGKSEYRIEPDRLLIGEHRITPPELADSLFQAYTHQILVNWAEQYLGKAVERNIISALQRRQLLELLEDKEISENANH